MTANWRSPCFSTACSLLVCLSIGRADDANTLSLLNLSAPNPGNLVVAQGDGETVTTSAGVPAPGVDVAFGANKEAWPGVRLHPASGTTWDLSSYGYVEAHVTNTGTEKLVLSLSVLNAGSNNGDAEFVTVKPGQAGVIRVYFGYAFNQPGPGIDTTKVATLLFYSQRATADRSFRLESAIAGGKPGDKPPIDPGLVRLKPEGGVILGNAALDPRQIVSKGGAQGTLSSGGKAVDIEFAGNKDESLTLKPVTGMWNLNEWLEVRVKLKNTGQTPVTPGVRIESKNGPSDTAVGAPLAPARRRRSSSRFRPPVRGRELASTPRMSSRARRSGAEFRAPERLIKAISQPA